VPVEERGTAIVALEEAVARERPILLLVAFREVDPPKLERVHAELASQRIHGALEGERPFHMARRAERRHRRRVHPGERFHGAHVRARIHLLERPGRSALPAADAEGNVGLADDGGEPAVAAGA
jgi:hypothetical protein